MLKTIIVCESTRGGTDSKLLKELILKHNLLDDENCEIHTTDDREKKSTGSITDVLDFLKLQLSNYTRGKFENVLIIVDADDNIKTRFDENSFARTNTVRLLLVNIINSIISN